jgi:hypothetical protein
MSAAVFKFCSVNAKRLGSVWEAFGELDVPLKVLDPFEEELVAELEKLAGPEVLDEVGDAAVVVEGFVGWNAELPLPKPISVASVPLPTIAIESFLFLLVITNLPLLLREAVTCALVGRSMLIASIRLPTVSVPVDV